MGNSYKSTEINIFCVGIFLDKKPIGWTSIWGRASNWQNMVHNISSTSLSQEMTKESLCHIRILYYTISSCVYAQFWTARIPLFWQNIILKSGVTQCKTWITIACIPLFHLNLARNTLRVYARGYGTLKEFDLHILVISTCNFLKHTKSRPASYPCWSSYYMLCQ